MEFQMLKDIAPHIRPEEIDRIEFRQEGEKPFDYEVCGVSWDSIKETIEHNRKRGYHFRLVLKKEVIKK